MLSPGWAPLRNTGGPLDPSRNSHAYDQLGPAAEVASDHRAVIRPRSFEDPLVKRAQLVGGWRRPRSPVRGPGVPPMAAMSLRFTAIAFQPKSGSEVSDKSASMPATTASAVKRAADGSLDCPASSAGQLNNSGVVSRPHFTLRRPGQLLAQERQQRRARCSAGPGRLGTLAPLPAPLTCVKAVRSSWPRTRAG